MLESGQVTTFRVEHIVPQRSTIIDYSILNFPIFLSIILQILPIILRVILQQEQQYIHVSVPQHSACSANASRGMVVPLKYM